MSALTPKVYACLVVLISSALCCSSLIQLFQPTDAGNQFQVLDMHLMDVLPKDVSLSANINEAAKLLEAPPKKKSSLMGLLKGKKREEIPVDRAVGSLQALIKADKCTSEVVHAIGFIYRGLYIGLDARKSGMEGLTRMNKIMNQLPIEQLLEDCRQSVDQVLEATKKEVDNDESVRTVERAIQELSPGHYKEGGPTKAELASVLFKLSKESGMIVAKKTRNNANGKLEEEIHEDKLMEAAGKLLLDPCEKILDPLEDFFTVIYELREKYKFEKLLQTSLNKNSFFDTLNVYEGCRSAKRAIRNDKFKQLVVDLFLEDGGN